MIRCMCIEGITYEESRFNETKDESETIESLLGVDTNIARGESTPYQLMPNINKRLQRVLRY